MEPMTLRQHRMSRGLTIREFAAVTGISTQTVVAIEHGKPAKMQTFKKVAEKLDIPIMEIREYRDLVMASDES